ncbi:MAG: DUF4230 domain-containing protein [Planctomycetota bacterium]
MTARRRPTRPRPPQRGRVLAVLVVLLLIMVVGLGGYAYLQQPPLPPRYTSTGPTVEQLEALGHMTVLKLSVADVLKGEGHGYKGAWLVRGDALYAVDMRRAEIDQREDTGRRATIVLPRPTLLQPRVDHNKTITYAVQRTNLIPGTGDQSKLRNESMKEAQELVERAAMDEEYVALAKRNAELVVRSMYALVDWGVDIEWDDEPRGSGELRAGSLELGDESSPPLTQ